MIAIVHSIYSQSVHAPALNAGLMDNDAERYCNCAIVYVVITLYLGHKMPLGCACIFYHLNNTI